jgi:hypothetical protein
MSFFYGHNFFYLIISYKNDSRLGLMVFSMNLNLGSHGLKKILSMS